MNKKALIKDLNEVYNLVSDHDITEAMERLEFVISEVKQLHIPVVVYSEAEFCECDGVQDLIAGTGECRKCGKECTY